jgi:hypothetical protein
MQRKILHILIESGGPMEEELIVRQQSKHDLEVQTIELCREPIPDYQSILHQIFESDSVSVWSGKTKQ